MASKRRKKRRPTRPRPSAGSSLPTRSSEERAGTSPADRQSRKEQARKERERRVKQSRRRQRTRRLLRWGVAIVLIAGLGGFIYWQTQASKRLSEQATAAAAELGCDPEIRTLQNNGAEHTEQPPNYAELGDLPAGSGPHSASPLAPSPAVYDQPIPEFQAVHNLEHAYAIIYYRADGPEALPEDVVDALADLTESENKVLMAPYPSLPDGKSVAFMGWTKTLQCPQVTDADAIVTVARAAMDKLKSDAPEPNAP